jgi:hypothetical protein
VRDIQIPHRMLLRSLPYAHWRAVLAAAIVASLALAPSARAQDHDMADM